MTKNELLNHIASQTQCTKAEAEQAIENVFGAIGEALERGDKVDLRGFGIFQVSAKSERQGRNPRTGETITIAARKAAVFKPSKELTARVNRTTDANMDRDNRDNHADKLPTTEPSAGPAKLHGDKIDS
jgi:DNA-binding protein HU-beta